MLKEQRTRTKKRIQAKIGLSHRVVARKSLKFFYGEIADMDKKILFGARIDIAGKDFDAKLKELAVKIVDFAKKNKIEKVAFDRNGYKYHGKVKAFADSLREAGLKI